MTEPSDDERAGAVRLADSWLLPQGRYGLPAAGAVRRRWLGVAPPGPLEQCDPPRWTRFVGGRAGRDALPSGPERTGALLDLASFAYPGAGLRLDDGALEEELAAAAPDVSSAEELALPCAASGQPTSLAAAALAILPLPDD